MDAERRQEWKKHCEDVKKANLMYLHVDPNEILALLARDEALERCEALPDRMRHFVRIDHPRMIDLVAEWADELDQTLGRNP